MLNYTDHFGRQRTAEGNSQSVEAHGPFLLIEPELLSLKVNGTDVEYLMPGKENIIDTRIWVTNLGDGIAQNTRIQAIIPDSVDFVSSAPSLQFITVCLQLTLSVTPPLKNDPLERFTVIDILQPEFRHMFLNQEVTALPIGPDALGTTFSPFDVEVSDLQVDRYYLLQEQKLSIKARITNDFVYTYSFSDEDEHIIEIAVDPLNEYDESNNYAVKSIAVLIGALVMALKRRL